MWDWPVHCGHLVTPAPTHWPPTAHGPLLGHWSHLLGSNTPADNCRPMDQHLCITEAETCCCPHLKLLLCVAFPWSLPSLPRSRLATQGRLPSCRLRSPSIYLAVCLLIILLPKLYQDNLIRIKMANLATPLTNSGHFLHMVHFTQRRHPPSPSSPTFCTHPSLSTIPAPSPSTSPTVSGQVFLLPQLSTHSQPHMKTET